MISYLLFWVEDKQTCWKAIWLKTFSWISEFFIYCLTKNNPIIDLNIGIEERGCWDFGQKNPLKECGFTFFKLLGLCMHSTWKYMSFACSRNVVNHRILNIILNLANKYFLFFPSELLLDNVEPSHHILHGA